MGCLSTRRNKLLGSRSVCGSWRPEAESPQADVTLGKAHECLDLCFLPRAIRGWDGVGRGDLQKTVPLSGQLWRQLEAGGVKWAPYSPWWGRVAGTVWAGSEGWLLGLAPCTEPQRQPKTSVNLWGLGVPLALAFTKENYF